MAVATINRFRTLPGRLADHLAASAEATGHLNRLGVQSMTLQAVAGGDVGSIATLSQYASNADWAAAMGRVLADEQWQEFWGRVTADQPAEQVESSILSDVDPNFAPDPDRQVGVISATQWRAKPGRVADFMGSVITSVGHIQRLGGQARVMQSLIGQHPITTTVGLSFPDLDAYGAFTDAAGTDEEFQTYWAGVGADPTADIVRSGIYLVIG